MRPPLQASACSADRSVMACQVLSTASCVALLGKMTTQSSRLRKTPKTMPLMRVAATMAASLECSAACVRRDADVQSLRRPKVLRDNRLCLDALRIPPSHA